MISDLLASITGEKSALPSSTVTKTASSAPKRKADEVLRAPAAKSPRTGLRDHGPSRQASDMTKSSLQPTNKPSLAASPANAKSTSVPRPSDRSSTSLVRKGNQDAPSKNTPTSLPASGRLPGPGRPDTKRPSPVESGPKAEPKKRSFAEIMARAKAAHTAGPTLGRIQHKALERAASKKEREEIKTEGARKARAAAKHEARPSGATHATRNESGLLRDRDGHRRGTTSTPSGGLVNRKAKKAPVVEEKKVKKAALATTGYTGTARPRPGGTSSKSKGSASGPLTASRVQPADKRRYGGALSRSRPEYDDEDDDLDDFIEYDDDEEPPYGHGGGGYGRGGYESPEESDMEAGMSDIDEEERRAEYQARREDQQQEALEKRLKLEKEEKKRKLLAAARARAR